MSPKDLVILGGGEHARVVIDAARSVPDDWHVVGVVDPAPVVETLGRFNVDHLGDDDGFVARYGRVAADARPWLIIGVGGASDPAARHHLATRYGAGTRWAIVVHAAAWVSPSATLGEGGFVGASAIVGTGARLGRHAIVNSGAVLEHDVAVGDFVQLAPGAMIGGGAALGDGAFVGLGAVVRDHVSVGDRAIVGMGSVVVEDVPPGAVVLGNPARRRSSR